MRRADQLAKFRTVGQTVSPERAIVLLYERMGRDLAQARIAIANGDTEADLSAFMSEILMAQMNPLEGAGAPGGATIDGTTVKFVDPGVASGGRLFALGKR